LQNRAGCGRVFGRTLAKPLNKKGDFVILVNEWLTLPLQAVGMAANGRDSIGT
jgi:hypothetical protein